MNDYTKLITDVGFPAFICYLLIEKVFALIKPIFYKKLNHGEGMLNELVKMNDNHLHSIEDAINGGNKEIVKAINDGNLKMVEMLGEIKGKLGK